MINISIKPHYQHVSRIICNDQDTVLLIGEIKHILKIYTSGHGRA